MDKVAFIADVHGNFPALRAALHDIDRRGINSIVCLGDVVGYFSMINEVIETLRQKNILTIMGNHDYALAFTSGVIDRSATCTKILKKQLTYITSDNLIFLKNLPQECVFTCNEASVFCVHGGLKNRIDEYLFDADENYFITNQFKYDCLVTGHTHRRINKKVGPFWLLNPGSVGQPRDEDKRASYLIFDGEKAEHFEIKYEVSSSLVYMG